MKWVHIGPEVQIRIRSDGTAAHTSRSGTITRAEAIELAQEWLELRSDDENAAIVRVWLEAAETQRAAKRREDRIQELVDSVIRAAETRNRKVTPEDARVIAIGILEGEL